MATELQRQVDYLEHCTDFNKDMDSSFCNPDDIEVYRRNKCYGGYVDYTIYGPGPSNTFNPSSQGHSQSQAPAMSSQATYQETTAPFQCSSASMIGPACPGQSSNFDPHFCQSLADCSLVPGVPFQTINPREHSLPSTSHPPFRRPSFPTYASTDSTHQHMTRMTVTSRHQSSGRANRGTIIDPSAMIHKPYATKKPQRTFTSHGPGPNF
ncbi:hypothetical protein BCR39DRAFT_525915 [Naematelia encephala]|uniref:Uncharacterized protein n=1 Tax=Naematelia encephala TaxID=71784 RepID=A0A1Y2BA17_9TREE|nr:hypothetical protein BCR39DRAFT_525915 [Naematelia encephala]